MGASAPAAEDGGMQTPAPSLQPLCPQRPWAQGPGVWDVVREAGGARRVKGSDPQTPCWATGAPCGFPSGHPRQCPRATRASASAAGPAPSLSLTPFASLSWEPDSGLCTPRGPAPPGMPPPGPAEPDGGPSPGACCSDGPARPPGPPQACPSGGHWPVKGTENLTQPEKEGHSVATRRPFPLHTE